MYTFISNTCTGSRLDREYNNVYNNPYVGSLFSK